VIQNRQSDTPNKG
jgi:small subunit ribosomal protein S10